MPMHRRSALAAAVVMGVLPLAACGGGSDETPAPTEAPRTSVTDDGSGSPTIDKIRQNGRLLMGTTDSLPGVSLQDQASGKYSGFDTQLAVAIAKEIGLKDPDPVRYRSAGVETRLNSLRSGDVDLVVGGIKTNQPQPQIAFVGPYLKVAQDLLVRSDSGITAAAQLDGKPVCVVAGTGAAQKLKAARVTQNVVEENLGSRCVEALQAGRVSAFSADDAVLRGYAAQSKGAMKVLGSKLTDEGYYIGIPARDKELRRQLEAMLKKSFQDGSWARMYGEVYGTAEPAPTPPVLSPAPVTTTPSSTTATTTTAPPR
ncbi:amino acid ABC transporter substrate-binding protein, PAAT family [Allokutzneria albata]|uniref:Amino acid ABC transporter substrate-binding protein, PAAT family n=2 Tax=Allokutzneria albata TaxID=211114 RepID=A0A1H0CTF1_ALLAB|nr:amino acid ABC transporter substrate-binding protein, PAAT family [Allokutzneria albata]